MYVSAGSPLILLLLLLLFADVFFVRGVSGVVVRYAAVCTCPGDGDVGRGTRSFGVRGGSGCVDVSHLLGHRVVRGVGGHDGGRGGAGATSSSSLRRASAGGVCLVHVVGQAEAYPPCELGEGAADALSGRGRGGGIGMRWLAGRGRHECRGGSADDLHIVPKFQVWVPVQVFGADARMAFEISDVEVALEAVWLHVAGQVVVVILCQTLPLPRCVAAQGEDRDSAKRWELSVSFTLKAQQ